MLFVPGSYPAWSGFILGEGLPRQANPPAPSSHGPPETHGQRSRLGLAWRHSLGRGGTVETNVIRTAPKAFTLSLHLIKFISQSSFSAQAVNTFSQFQKLIEPGTRSESFDVLELDLSSVLALRKSPRENLDALWGPQSDMTEIRTRVVSIGTNEPMFLVFDSISTLLEL